MTSRRETFRPGDRVMAVEVFLNNVPAWAQDMTRLLHTAGTVSEVRFIDYFGDGSGSGSETEVVCVRYDDSGARGDIAWWYRAEWLVLADGTRSTPCPTCGGCGRVVQSAPVAGPRRRITLSGDA